MVKAHEAPTRDERSGSGCRFVDVIRDSRLSAARRCDFVACLNVDIYGIEDIGISAKPVTRGAGPSAVSILFNLQLAPPPILPKGSTLEDPLIIKVLPSHIPSHLPPFPPVYTFQRTETHVNRYSDQAVVRELRSREKTWSGIALEKLEGQLRVSRVKKMHHDEQDTEMVSEEDVLVKVLEGRHTEASVEVKKEDGVDEEQERKRVQKDRMWLGVHANWEVARWQQENKRRRREDGWELVHPPPVSATGV